MGALIDKVEVIVRLLALGFVAWVLWDMYRDLRPREQYWRGTRR